MQINLKNIGIVKDSSITIDGLTVITGKNNSGKTTVGKTLYALLDAVSDIQQKSTSDKLAYILFQLDEVESTLEVFRFLRTPVLKDQIDIFAEYPALKLLLSREYRHEIPSRELEQFAHKLADELSFFDSSLFEKDKDLNKYQRYLRINSTAKEGAPFANMFDNQRDQAIARLNKLFSDLEKDPELIAYARESINQTLKCEFANQIQPVSAPETLSKVELSDSQSVYFSFSIANNNVVNDGAPVYISSPFKKVYLIDDPFILDDIYFRRIIRSFDFDDGDTIFNSNRIYSHSYKLKLALRSRKPLSVFEQTVLSDSLVEINNQFDNIIPGTFEFTSDGDYYVRNGSKLKLSNLATGSKMFSIVRILLDKGEIDNTTMLILDEPESHLHPMWQNAFAEIIVLLVKKIGVNILLTTHSPNFMLALDAYMRKYDIADITNFYQTDVLEDNFVHYNCVNDDMGKIYQDFLQYLSEVKMLRNAYLNNIGE